MSEEGTFTLLVLRIWVDLLRCVIFPLSPLIFLWDTNINVVGTNDFMAFCTCASVVAHHRHRIDI